MSSAICKESHAGARDNIVGAIARLIITNYFNIPLDQVFPIFVKQLPLKEDFEEYKAVFRSILTLYEAGHPILQPHMTILLKVAVIVLHENKTTDDGMFHDAFLSFSMLKSMKLMLYICKLCIHIFYTEAKGIVMEFVKSAQRDFPNEWNSVYAELPVEIATDIQRIFS